MKRGDTLKYGFKAPLLDYYGFNCSRQYDVRTTICTYTLFCCYQCCDNQDWSYDRAQLIYMREIGEGQFGKVLLMKAKVIDCHSLLKSFPLAVTHLYTYSQQDICGVQGSVLVAVKTLTSRDPKDIQRFSEEMGLMKKFIHPNIVSLLGTYVQLINT